MDLVVTVYKLTKDFPGEEKYNLVSQMRRSAVSIPSNIAEGYKRDSTADYKRFLNIAEASAVELETQMLISKRLYSDFRYEPVEKLIEEIQKMLYVLVRKLESK